ncbi:alpha/beta fold hydrolase [Sinorhizobium meliloti]|uniref:alpha/beta fold hydrolase n=1 Tax=Rhizobium meliloti TaxID=382 RepID=UPI000FDA9A90|nr:alpha/beta fold hydrolase [Sinorhizobium meliloti]RVH08539.1 alpha/beta fold hydrolase [Sinorhizobium meliloti]
MTRVNAIFLALISTVFAAPVFAGDDQLVRTDRFVTLAGGERLFVREVRPAERQQAASAVLLIHGARVPSVASFDLAVPGGSIAAELAAEGHSVYLVDLRGYGASSRPHEMDAPPGGGTPLMRTDEAVSDIAAAVEAVAEWSGDGKVSILGWATGGQWAAAFAARHSARVERLILYNSLYGVSDRHPTLGRGSPLEAPDRPGSLNMAALGAYRLNTAESLFAAWDKSIPVPDKSEWRDPAVARAYADMALSSDPTSGERTPPSFRSPSGAMADSFELAFGRKQWSAAALTMPVLVIRSQHDFWSRPEDAAAIAREAPQASLVELPHATHFVHLDRSEAGRSAFLSAVTQFLEQAAR